MKNVHLVCNAHLDPVWLWRWEEGCSEALSTFRTAVRLIDEFPGFVFCHNESLLYEWVRQFDPALFEAIRQRVSDGRWHIAGGWHLQPDCNMPSGESFVRNMIEGRRFFRDAFDKVPTTAVNFDSFGHSRGLVQLLRQAGYDSYVVCRPSSHAYPFASQDFVWRGLDGSEILVHRSDENYNSVWGQAASELCRFLEEKADEAATLFLWGVGDHGGGPSRKDLSDLRDLMAGGRPAAGTAASQHSGISSDEGRQSLRIIHSTPEDYFREIHPRRARLPIVETGLNPVAPGCYTSQIRVKQHHRRLESEFFSTERMEAAAVLASPKDFEPASNRTALRDLLFSQFHDALPGSGTREVEEDTLLQLDHGLQETAVRKHRAFLALSAGQPEAEPDTSVVLVYNPHPFEITGVLEAECVTPKQNWDNTVLMPAVRIGGTPVRSQLEKESANFGIDWRKKIVVHAVLPPFRMSRLDIRFHPEAARPAPPSLSGVERFRFDSDRMRVSIDMRTGLLDDYSVDGRTLCLPGSFRLVASADTSNSWGISKGHLVDDGNNAFRLLSPQEGSAFSGLSGPPVPSVRIIEDGAVRTIIEAVFGYRESRAVLRYLLPKRGASFEVQVRVFWNEKDTSLKLCADAPFEQPECWGQIAFGRERLPADGSEAVMQQWCALQGVTPGTSRVSALAIINDGIHGVSAMDGTIGVTLLRSAAYSAGSCVFQPLQEARFTDRMEQGERSFRFRVEAGPADRLMHRIDSEAAIFNEPPHALACNPAGTGIMPAPAIEMDNPAIRPACLKVAEDGDGFILRLYECEGRAQSVRVRLNGGQVDRDLPFKPFEIRTFRFRPSTGELISVGMLEEIGVIVQEV